MDFLTLAKERCSVRNYKSTAVEEEKLEKILKAAHVAPTAANMQPQKLLVVREKEALKKLEEGVQFHNAPLAIIVCGDHNTAWVRPFDKKAMVDIDSTIVADHIVMEAEDLGLGTCWLTYFKPEVIRKNFKIPENLEPVVIISIGYSAKSKDSAERHSQTRKPLESMIVYDSF